MAGGFRALLAQVHETMHHLLAILVGVGMALGVVVLVVGVEAVVVVVVVVRRHERRALVRIVLAPLQVQVVLVDVETGERIFTGSNVDEVVLDDVSPERVSLMFSLRFVMS